jgi:uncharacterized membrane protein YeiB
MNQKKPRLIGIDVARALAVIGMIIVNFKVVFGEQGAPWLKSVVGIFDGKAAATFVVLAGVGLALMTNSAVRSGDKEKLNRSRKRIGKRALFLFFVGLSYIFIWPADILHFYGVYMLIALLMINRSNTFILVSAGAIIFLFPVLLFLFDYEAGWNFETLDYLDFWKVEGFFRNLFFNGFHPVIPWSAFMLFGIWLGRQDLYDNQRMKKICVTSLIIFLAIQLVSFLLQSPDEDLNMLFGTDPMPPLLLYMLNGMAIAAFILSGSILLARRFEKNPILQALNNTGQLALTFYVAHVVLGMGLVEVFGSQALGTYPLTFSLVYALIFSTLCIVFAMTLLKYRKSGPLEWLMRKVTD